MTRGTSEIEAALAEIKAVVEGRRLPSDIPAEKSYDTAREPLGSGGGDGRSRAPAANGSDRLIHIDLQQLAALLGAAPASVRERVSLNAARGRWKMLSGGEPPRHEIVEMPASDLNEELDRAYDGDETDLASATSELQEALDAATGDGAYRQADGEEDLVALKETLVEAHARLVAMQAELRSAKAELVELREERLMLRRIAGILDEWRASSASDGSRWRPTPSPFQQGQ